MGTGIDLSVLRQSAHSPSYLRLSRSMGEGTAAVVDFCIPCNPYFPSPEMFAELGQNLETILKYYPSDADTITSELCGVLRLHPQPIAMANGSTELLTWIDHLLVGESLATPIPTFGRWTDQPQETGKRVDMFPLRESFGFQLNVDEFVHFVRQRRSPAASGGRCRSGTSTRSRKRSCSCSGPTTRRTARASACSRATVGRWRRR